MLYRARHVTRYVYESPVSHCLNEVRLTPRVTGNQQLRESAIRVEPEPTAFQNRKDYFGNDVTTFAVFETHDRLTTTATSIVDVQAEPATIEPALTWEEARDEIANHTGPGCLEALEFVFDSPFVTTTPELLEFAAPTFTPRRPLIEAVKELSHRIYTEFTYQPKSTSIEMPMIEAFRRKTGVCQDFAHIMIGTLRSLHLAARYVSGYLRSGTKYQGAEASHAWVSVFVPGRGWQAFDPTNDVLPSGNHLTLAWGRDYGDVTPVKGVAIGGGGHTVEVEVEVRPLAR